MKLSVILPARNEQQHLNNVLQDITNHLNKKKYRYEVLVIVNGSTDNTKQIVIDFSKRNKKVKLLTSRSGYGNALKKGFSAAKGNFVSILNVDFYDLHLLDLADIDLYGKDLIIGSKTTHWSQDYRSLSRRIITLTFNAYLKLFHQFKGSDTHGIKIFRQSVLQSVLPQCKTRSGILDTEFVIKTQRSGFKIADFPVTVSEIRPPRFKKRLIQTPKDIHRLVKALKKTDLKRKEQFYNQLNNWDLVINNKETDRRLDIIFHKLLPLKNRKNKKLLDLGCGLGYFTEFALKEGYHVTGVDIGEKIIKNCKKKFPQAKFISAPTYNLPLKDKSFDFVIFTEVLEHIPFKKQNKTLREISRVLKPEGYLVLTTPNRLWLSLFSLLSFLQIRPYHGIEHWLWPTKLIELLTKNSFSITKKLGFNHLPPTNNILTNIDDQLSSFWLTGINVGVLAQKSK